jgi:hypothetical protein
MELRQDLQELGERLRRLRYDPPAYRMAVAAVLVAVGMAGVTIPFDGSLETRRGALTLAEERARIADSLRDYLDSCGLAASRIPREANDVEWGGYMMDQLGRTGLRLVSQQPPTITDYGEFRTIGLTLQASGSYEAITDFVDRLERGPRLIRIERLKVEMVQDSIEVEIEALGLAGGNLEAIPESLGGGGEQ